MEQSDLVGEWELVTWTHLSKEDKQLFFPFGKRPMGYMKFTKDSFLSHATKNSERVESAIKLKCSLYNAGVTELSLSGTYELDSVNNSITFCYEESSIAILVSQKRQRKIWFDGHETLMFSSERVLDGKVYSIKATFIRAIDS